MEILYSYLSNLTLSQALAILLVATLGFALLLTLREFVAWYLKIHQTQDALDRLKTEIEDLRQDVAQLRKTPHFEDRQNPIKPNRTFGDSGPSLENQKTNPSQDVPGFFFLDSDDKPPSVRKNSFRIT